MNQEKPRVHSVREAANELNVSVSTLKHRLKDGTINAVRLGRRVLITEREIARLLGET